MANGKQYRLNPHAQEPCKCDRPSFLYHYLTSSPTPPLPMHFIIIIYTHLAYLPSHFVFHLSSTSYSFISLHHISMYPIYLFTPLSNHTLYPLSLPHFSFPICMSIFHTRLLYHSIITSPIPIACIRSHPSHFTISIYP